MSRSTAQISGWFRMARRRLVVVIVCLVCLVSVCIAWMLLAHGQDNDVGRVRVLPDGSKLRLEQVLFTSRSFSYSFVEGGKPVYWILSKLPVGLRKKLKVPGGGVAYGGSIPGTNLLIVTVQRQQGGPGALKSLSEVGRLRVCDEFGNRSEECSSTPFSGPPGVVGQLWIVSAFPRRTRTITLECLATNVQGGWLKIAEFRVPNPAWANYPKWKPEAMPVTKLDGGLAVTLETFQSGWRMPAPGGLGDAATAARKTRLVLSFLENGRPCSDWAIKHLVCIDATGNRCFGFPDAAYLDPGRAAFDIYRPLWPGEQAWKVRAEFSRVAGFTPLDLWQVSFNLPGPGTVSRLTNAGTHNGVALKLAVVASPHVELGSPFVSVGQKEPDDSENFYALGLQFEGPFADRWVNILRMTDEHGVQLSLTGGLSNLSPTKKLFFKPGIGVKSVKLTMAVPIDRVVEFMARPQLVDDMTAVAIE